MSEQIVEFLNQPLIAINLGLDKFAESLQAQGVEVVRVDWRPPAGGDQEMIELLDQLL
jgi:hypothetical protein